VYVTSLGTKPGKVQDFSLIMQLKANISIRKSLTLLVNMMMMVLGWNRSRLVCRSVLVAAKVSSRRFSRVCDVSRREVW